MTRYWPLVLILTTIFTGIFTASCGAGSMDFHGALPQQSELRPDNPTSTEMFRFESDETVEFLDSAGGEFRIHYTRSGTNAVPDTDADTSGVPDYVELVANTYDEVLDYYQNTLGLRRPLGDAALADNGGDGRFDVYLIDFGASSDGAFRTEACLDGERERCLGFMVQENDFVNYGYSSLEEACRVLGSHEFFHAVQAAYDSDNDLERAYGVISEGTAVWATENFDPSLDDFEHLIPGYMDATDRPLGTPPNMGFSYGSAILFKFLEERFNDPTIIRKIWEKMENGVDGIADPDWLEILPPLLQNEYAVTFDEVMVDFAIWNLYTLRRADPSVSYENGAAYASVAYESVKTPVALEQERFYYSATRYFSVSILDRDKIGAALVGDPEELEDMHLILIGESGNELTGVAEIGDLSAGEQFIEADSVDRVWLLVVNGGNGESASSRRPNLCIGTEEELHDCIETFAPGTFTNGDDDDGCAALGGSSFLWVFMPLLGLVRRRTKRS